ncbi:hypothetical protein SASPL_145276 [Salvia splendens]|uniref:Retrotransposon gag domain-containing protein n=1 Tax=Salvia splendens TaxID=180675 RepID=A0A8X8WHB4_SALSN|nr:hypothetical protein SASPL_145276 [Salvia splendens]
MSGDEASSRILASSESVGIAGNAPPRQSSVIKEIHEYRAKEFSGKQDDDPTKCATALLKEEAHRWWASVARATPPEIMTWDFFLNKFCDFYVGEQYMDDRRQEFQLLVQGRMTGGLVGLETSDLTKLSHAARNLEQLKISEKVEEGSMNQEKRQAESSHSASRFSGKRFRDYRARGQRPVSEPIQKPTSRAPSRAYSMRTREDSDAPDVILEHSLPLEKTKYDILVPNPLANLMELPFREFDIILGMDWLYVHHALVDCCKKRIILYALDGHEVIVVGERSDYLDNVISATTACKLVGKGCEAYLAFILDT